MLTQNKIHEILNHQVTQINSNTIFFKRHDHDKAY